MPAALRFSEIRPTLALILLAMFGGVIAVAWGNRRLTRPQRLAMVDARTQLQVLLDALRARTAVLARRDDLTGASRADVDEAVMTHVLIDSTLARAATADEVHSLRQDVFTCLTSLEHAARAVGLDLPADQPFRGLCSIDPQHGAATASPDGDGLCRACVDALMEGRSRPVRLVAKNGRPVPFNDIERSQRRP